MCTELGGGRKVKSDKIDFGVGFVFNKKVGDKVKKGDSILTIYHHQNQSQTVEFIQNFFSDSIIKYSKSKVKKPDTIYETID